MSSENHTIVILNEPLVERNIYRFLMHLGLIATLGMIVVYLLELLIYPQYIYTMLAEGLIPALVYNNQLNLVHSMDFIMTISIGLGFFGAFAKYGKRSGYIFLLLYIFPIISLQQSIGYFLIGITTIDESLIWNITEMGLEIGKSVILALLLYHNLWSVSKKQAVGSISLTLVASQLVRFVWRFSTQHLAPVYDFSSYDITQWTVVGSFDNTMFIVIPQILGAIICAIIFAAFFVYENRKEQQSVNEGLRNKEVIGSTPTEFIISR